MLKKRDPVCGVKVKNAEYTSKHGSRIYYFHGEACKTTFEENPGRFAEKKPNRGFLKWIAKGTHDIPKSCHEIKK